MVSVVGPPAVAPEDPEDDDDAPEPELPPPAAGFGFPVPVPVSVEFAESLKGASVEASPYAAKDRFDAGSEESYDEFCALPLVVRRLRRIVMRRNWDWAAPLHLVTKKLGAFILFDHIETYRLFPKSMFEKKVRSLSLSENDGNHTFVIFHFSRRKFFTVYRRAGAVLSSSVERYVVWIAERAVIIISIRITSFPRAASALLSAMLLLNLVHGKVCRCRPCP